MDAPNPPLRRARGSGPVLVVVGLALLVLGTVTGLAGVFFGVRSVATTMQQSFVAVDRGDCERFTPVESRSHTVWVRDLNGQGIDPALIASALRVTEVESGREVRIAASISTTITVMDVKRKSVGSIELVAGREVEICLTGNSPVAMIEIAPQGLDAGVLAALVPCFAFPIAFAGLVMAIIGGILWLSRAPGAPGDTLSAR